MEFSYNFVSLIDTLGVIQGVLFGLMLLFLHSKSNKPTLFLGLFILLFALEPIPNILEDLEVLKQYPKWELFPVNFHFLAYPLFYIYIQKISILKNEKSSYWTLIPGLIEIFATFIIFVLPVTTKLQLKDSPYATFYFVMGLLYTCYICFLILKWIRSHGKEVAEQYSTTNRKTLEWSRWFIYISIIFHLLLLSSYFIDNLALYVFVSILNVILIYWVSFKGIAQQNVIALIWASPDVTREEEVNIPYKNQHKEQLNITSNSNNNSLTVEEVSEILETVTEYMLSSECYINDKLTIIDVAEAVNIHPKRISHSLNSKLNVNFNRFINSYRIEKAKKLLKSDSTKNLSVEGIGFEVGFRSKTSFYSAFKKIVGTTPAKYKNS